jgi:hypothetical protein
MAGQNLLDFLNSLDGQCQAERFPAALDPAAAPIDDRSTQQMLQDLRQNLDTKLAGLLPQTAVATPDGTLPPHHGLLLAILQLLKHPQRLLNTFTERHLAFQFQQILGFRTRPPIPNRTWVSLSLKKNAAPVVLGRSDCLVAGEGPDGQPQLFAPVRPLYVGQAKLATLCRQRLVNGTVCADEVSPQDAWKQSSTNGWAAFGNDSLPQALFGFAVASPLLRLAEGQRTMKVRISFDQPLTSLDPATSFLIAYTSEEGWRTPDSVKCTTDNKDLLFTITVNKKNLPVTDYDRSTHDGQFATTDPILRFVYSGGNATLLQTLSSLVVQRVAVQVKAEEIRKLQIRNSSGLQDPARSFPLFGPIPEAGSTATIDYAEAMAKPLARLSLKPTTTTTPTPSWDISVSAQTVCNNPFIEPESTQNTQKTPSIATKTLILKRLDSAMLLQSIENLSDFQVLRDTPPVASSAAQSQESLITLTLRSPKGDAKKYPLELAEYLAGKGTTPMPPPEPYILNSLELTYETEWLEDHIGDGTNVLFSGEPVQFFQIDSFGVRRDHAAIRRLLRTEFDTTVRLLPELAIAGDAVFFGFEDLQPGESLSLLVDVLSASGTSDQPGISWFLLCGNFWKRLTSEEILTDTTAALRQPGLLQFKVPAFASTDQTIMPAGKIWLKACSASPSFRCSLAGIYCHAVEIEFVSGNPELAAAPLPPDSITRLQNPIAGIRSVQQPLPGFGGRAAESPREMSGRAAERLRHRNRAVNLWDYERLVLNEFPDIERVKCIPHSDGQNWNRPGHVAVVLVPDVSLRTRAAETLRPAIPQSRLTEVETFLNSLCPLGVKTHALSPCYQEIRAAFHVRFQPGLPFTYYRSLLEQSLTGYLAPWTISASANIRFGHTIYRSAVLNHIEDLDYVDFVTDFNCFLTAAPEVTRDEWLLQATRPDGVLTSAASHDIREYRGT